MATDSAKYCLSAVNLLETQWRSRLAKVRCPSHLLHDMVEFVVNLTAADLGVLILFPRSPYHFLYISLVGRHTSRSGRAKGDLGLHHKRHRNAHAARTLRQGLTPFCFLFLFVLISY